VQNTYKSITEGSGDRCRRGDWGKYDSARLGRKRRTAPRGGKEQMVRGQGPGGNGVVLGVRPDNGVVLKDMF
jgi:hypothetical protein